LKTTFRIEKQRLNWIDQARGFVMFMLVLSGLMPGIWRTGNDIAHFFLEHPANDRYAQYMNLYDIGVPAFFFIIGLLMAVSFKKRVESKGKWPAILNAVIRWGLISAVGLLFIIIPGILNGSDPSTWFGEIDPYNNGFEVFVVYWDVVIALGIVGLICIPFLLVPRKARLIISYAMMTFYQIMLFIPETLWREYAANSVHGGIIGGIFVLVSITLIASVVGEFFILDKETPVKEKNKKFLILGLVNAIIGIALWLIPGGYPNKRQDTMAWATISMAVCFFVGYAFILIDYKEEEFQQLHPINKGRIVLFKAYGMNPFLIYAIVTIAVVVIENLIGSDPDIQLLTWLIIVPAITIVALLLYKKGKAISTTKVALGVIVIVIVLAVALIPILA
jgi:hypothetical protein